MTLLKQFVKFWILLKNLKDKKFWGVFKKFILNIWKNFYKILISPTIDSHCCLRRGLFPILCKIFWISGEGGTIPCSPWRRHRVEESNKNEPQIWKIFIVNFYCFYFLLYICMLPHQEWRAENARMWCAKSRRKSRMRSETRTNGVCEEGRVREYEYIYIYVIYTRMRRIQFWGCEGERGVSEKWDIRGRVHVGTWVVGTGLM